MTIDKIKINRDFAVSQLEQVSFISVAFYFSRSSICNFSKNISENPEIITFQYNKELILKNFKSIEKRSAELFTEKGYGHFANKMVIVYSASILENYLREIGKLFELDKIKKEPCPSCGNKEEPLPHSFDGIVKRFKDSNLILETNGYEQSYLMSLIRHKIIHNKGRVDREFKEKLKKLNCNEANFLKNLQVNDPVSIPIDKIILPCLEKSICFVKESSDKFEATIGNRG